MKLVKLAGEIYPSFLGFFPYLGGWAGEDDGKEVELSPDWFRTEFWI